MVIHLVSPDKRYDMVYLRNYALLQVKDQLARIPGVGQVLIFGAGDYAMRIWVDPQKVAARGLSAGDVVNAIREQNVQVAAGVIGGPPMRTPVAYQLSVNAHGRLLDEQEFGDVIIKTGAQGEMTRLRTSPGSGSRPATTRSAPSSTTRTPSPLRSSRRPAPTRSSFPPRCGRRWRSSRQASPRGSSTGSSTTPRSTFGIRSAKW
jgi:hypothetical protein